MFRKDNQWSRQAFLVPTGEYPVNERYLRAFNTADLKYHDTAIGGSIAINPLPQFTRYADPPILNGLNKQSTGQGGTFSEAFDDNQQIIHLRFGVAKYNPMTTFLTGLYNYRAGVVARTGRVPEGFYLVGNALGVAVNVASFFIFPLFTALSSGVALFGYGARFFLNKPSSKYYYLKPTMTTYWTITSIVLNYLAVNMGYLSQQADSSDAELKTTDNKGLTAAERQYMHDQMPDLFSKDGFIDAYAVASRPQRLARKQEENMTRMLTATAPSNPDTWFGKIGEINDIINFTVLGANALSPSAKSRHTLSEYLAAWKKVSEGQVQPNSTVERDSRQVVKNSVAGASTGDNSVVVLKDAANDGWYEFLKSEWDDGGAFASFRVDYTGTTTESFSNSTADSDIKSKINSISSMARNSILTIAGREIAEIPVIGDLLSFGASAVKDTLGGIADSTGFSGLMALGGSALADIPKHWQDSSFSGPKMNYSMTLDALYNHPFSRIKNQYLPLAMLIAGSIPLGTGKQSYTSPFLCECYDRGRAATRLAIIRDLSITRGGGNLGFTNSGLSLSIDVSFSIEDLSSVMAAPLSAFYSTNIVKSSFDDDTNFSDYMAVLTGMGLTDMTYPSNKVARNWKRNVVNLRRYVSPAYWGSVFGNKLPTKIMSIYYKGVDKR